MKKISSVKELNDFVRYRFAKVVLSFFIIVFGIFSGLAGVISYKDQNVKTEKIYANADHVKDETLIGRILIGTEIKKHDPTYADFSEGDAAQILKVSDPYTFEK